MKQYEAVLGKILSIAILIGGIALIVIWQRSEAAKAAQVGLTVADARNTTLLLLIPGILMIALGLMNIMPAGLRPKLASSTDVAIQKLLSVVILLGGIAFLIMWGWQQQLLLNTVGVSVEEARIPTLLLFIPGTLFVGLGIVNLLPDSLRGIGHKPAAEAKAEEAAPAE